MEIRVRYGIESLYEISGTQALTQTKKENMCSCQQMGGNENMTKPACEIIVYIHRCVMGSYSHRLVYRMLHILSRMCQDVQENIFILSRRFNLPMQITRRTY